jgi:hypothetical protein
MVIEGNWCDSVHPSLAALTVSFQIIIIFSYSIDMWLEDNIAANSMPRNE